MLNVFKSIVRNLLEYYSLLWSPTKITDIQESECPENIHLQIAGCHDLDYWERLKNLYLISLQR